MNRFALFFLLIALAYPTQSQDPLGKIPKGSDATVIIFLAVDCPISQKYIPTINNIYEKYSGAGVGIHAVIPGRTRKKDLKIFKEEYGILFSIFPDRTYEFVRAVSAEATPEVFVFDNRGAIRYRGAIDNWFYELGGYRKEATEDYLIEAVDALLHGGSPAIAKTKALGCTIQIPMRQGN